MGSAHVMERLEVHMELHTHETKKPTQPSPMPFRRTYRWRGSHGEIPAQRAHTGVSFHTCCGNSSVLRSLPARSHSPTGFQNRHHLRSRYLGQRRHYRCGKAGQGEILGDQCDRLKVLSKHHSFRRRDHQHPPEGTLSDSPLASFVSPPTPDLVNTKGSHGIQERLPVDMSKSITFGNDTLGTGDTSVLTKVSKG